MKNLIHLLILIISIFWLGGCDQKLAIEPSGKTIKVGIIAPFSGSDEAKGKEGLIGMETAMQLQPYLQNGDRIELVAENDKDDPALTAKLLKKLVEKDNVSAIITFSSSSPVLAMAKIANDFKTPILAALATHPDITENNDFISQLCLDGDFQGTVTALFVRDELLIDKVAVFSNPGSAHSSHLASKFEHKFKSIGGEITDMISLTEETGDLSKVIKSVHDNTPELLYLPISAQDVIRIIREVQELDWNPKMMGSDGLIATILAEHEEELDLVEGVLAADLFAHGMSLLTPFGKKVREQYESGDKYESRGRATTYATLGVEGYTILLNALNRCSDPEDRECLNNQIRATTNFIGMTGKITITPNGKAQRPFFINSIQGGLARFIIKVY
jgi:branched-chain amino acid transport system substrate-binding protein